jgi:hypothetical protein
MKGHLKLMSHHFDTAIAREDPRLNLLDFYLFRGQPGTTVMAMTVNPNAGTKAPDTFHEEGLYATGTILSGGGEELVELAKTNLRELAAE